VGSNLCALRGGVVERVDDDGDARPDDDGLALA
jgi:hypothetical protein